MRVVGVKELMMSPFYFCLLFCVCCFYVDRSAVWVLRCELLGAQSTEPAG